MSLATSARGWKRLTVPPAAIMPPPPLPNGPTTPYAPHASPYPICVPTGRCAADGCCGSGVSLATWAACTALSRLRPDTAAPCQMCQPDRPLSTPAGGMPGCPSQSRHRGRHPGSHRQVPRPWRGRGDGGPAGLVSAGGGDPRTWCRQRGCGCRAGSRCRGCPTRGRGGPGRRSWRCRGRCRCGPGPRRGRPGAGG